MRTRPLDDGDYEAFESAANSRRAPKSRDEIRAAIRAKNPWRWWRMQNDFKWLQRYMKKQGYNPEDAREIL